MEERPSGCLDLGCIHWAAIFVSPVLMAIGIAIVNDPGPRSPVALVLILIFQCPAFALYTIIRSSLSGSVAVVLPSRLSLIMLRSMQRRKVRSGRQW